MIEALDYLSVDTPILLIGPPGVGKTAQVEEWARSKELDIIIEHPVIAQSIDYRGLPAAFDGYAEWLPIGTLRRITEPSCPPTLVLLDDLGQATPAVQAAVMQLLLARRLGDATINPRVTFVACSNRVVDRSGVRPMLAALINRLWVIQVEVDIPAWSSWVLAQKDVDPLIAGYARFRPDCFSTTVPEEAMRPYCTPRSLTMMGRLAARGMRDVMLLSGCVGGSTAADYLAYVAAASKLPNIDTILDAPSKWPTPTDPGLLHALTVLASRRAEERPNDIVALANHLKGGWGVTLISASADASKSFKSTAPFQSWAAQHKEIL